jgi:glucosamine--fructose-6-phosphate aminotransferase (isomerizing)
MTKQNEEMLAEARDIPMYAERFLIEQPAISLPLGIPYIGMGSSYFAVVAFKYLGTSVRPELASEYFNYQQQTEPKTNAVLISQSGRSSEVLWCCDLFTDFFAISNDTKSELCTHRGARKKIDLRAGVEKYSSSKTYVNTLLALSIGLGVELKPAARKLQENIYTYERNGTILANAIANLINAKRINGLYITGSGPNIATALQAALILSETTKLNFHGLPMAQYDHGVKETAKDSIVIQITSKGRSLERTIELGETISAHGGHVFYVDEQELSEHESILSTIIQFNFLSIYLAARLGVTDTFLVGSKVTEV